MDDGTKLCELCGMHKKLSIGPAGALWLEKDGAGDAVLMVEPVVGRTLPVAVPVWFCPACGRDFRPRKSTDTAEEDAQNPPFPYVGRVYVTPYAKDKIKEEAEKNGCTEYEQMGRILETYFGEGEKDEAGT